MKQYGVTKALALTRHPLIDFGNHPRGVDCGLMEYFGIACKDCWIKKYSRARCCDGPCGDCSVVCAYKDWRPE
jgi:hypothetical protein